MLQFRRKMGNFLPLCYEARSSQLIELSHIDSVFPKCCDDHGSVKWWLVPGVHDAVEIWNCGYWLKSQQTWTRENPFDDHTWARTSHQLLWMHIATSWKNQLAGPDNIKGREKQLQLPKIKILTLPSVFFLQDWLWLHLISHIDPCYQSGITELGLISIFRGHIKRGWGENGKRSTQQLKLL